jgi:hypothetical protein
MKKLFALSLGLLLIQVISASAWIGGPWSRNSYSYNQENGVYQATATYRNGQGIMKFAVNNASTAFDTGTSIWWFRGVTYVGNALALVDNVSDVVAGTNTASTLDFRAIGDAGLNRRTLTASWSAKIETQHPVLQFSGTGRMAAFGDLDTGQTQTVFNFNTPIIVTGPDGDELVEITTQTRSESGTGGEDEDYRAPGLQQKLRIYGNQTSLF